MRLNPNSEAEKGPDVKPPAPRGTTYNADMSRLGLAARPQAAKPTASATPPTEAEPVVQATTSPPVDRSTVAPDDAAARAEKTIAEVRERRTAALPPPKIAPELLVLSCAVERSQDRFLDDLVKEINQLWGLRNNMGLSKSSLMRVLAIALENARPQIMRIAEQHHAQRAWDLGELENKKDREGLQRLSNNFAVVIVNALRAGAMPVLPDKPAGK